MLTIISNGPAPMRSRHRPTDVKRLVAMLPTSAYGDWLGTNAERTTAFMSACPTSKSVCTA